MQQKIVIIIVLLFSAGILFASGQSDGISPAVEPVQAVEDNSFQVTDSLGRVVEFDRPPARIFQVGKVAFILTNTMYLFPEARESFLGTSRANQGFGFFAEAVDSGFTDKIVYEHSVSIEEIVTLRPDLVIVKDFLAKSMEKSFTDFGIKTLFMNLETPDTFYDEVLTIGDVFDNPGRAEEINGWYKARMDEISEKLRSGTRKEKPEVLVVYYNMKDGVSSFSVPPMHYIQTDMVKFAGGIPVWRDMELGQRWTKVGLEQIAAWNPDYVFVVSYFSPAAEVVNEIRKDSVWQTLDAVQGDRIYAFPHDYHSWDQPGPGWVLGYRWLAGILNPELISSEPAVMEVVAREFFSFAYGVNDELFDSALLPRIRGE